MANPTAAIQAWGAADYDWLTASSGFPAYEIQQNFDAWLQQIVTNPSVIAQSNVLPRLLKGVESSNNPLYYGMTMAFPQEAGHELFMSMHSRSTSYGQVCFGPTWVDDGELGGYGSFGGYTGSSLPNYTASYPQRNGFKEDFRMRTSTYDMSFMTWQDITDGEEAWGVCSFYDGLDSSSYSWAYGVWRDSNGHWFGFQQDDSNTNVIGYGFDTRVKTGMSVPKVKAEQSSYMPEHMVNFRNLTSIQDPPTNADQLYWYPANENIINWYSNTAAYPGSYAYINGTAEVYLKVCGGRLWVRYNPVGQY